MASMDMPAERRGRRPVIGDRNIDDTVKGG
jgi:hypothetical protein